MSHGFEGKACAITATSTVSDGIITAMGEIRPDARALSERWSSACSRIVGPDGREVAPGLIDDGGIVNAGIDPRKCIRPRQMHDITGHHDRFDVFNLHVNHQPRPPASFHGRAASVVMHADPEERSAETESLSIKGVCLMAQTEIKPEDDILGRARVRDTPELEAYYDDLARIETGALWTVANDIEPWEPTPKSAPVLWQWKDIRREVLRAIDLVRPEDAGRRVVYLRNPGRKEVSACCGWLFSGIQTMKAGERAGAHRHAASALRFIMEGSGAYTIVDGHRVELGAHDFVLTPNGSWHEHGILETGTECIWQDGLDIPLTNCLDADSDILDRGSGGI